MIIEQVFVLHAPRDETAAFFVDVDRVGRCVPGVADVEEVQPGSYRAVLGVTLGPIRAAFQGTMELDDSEAPERLRATGEGRDRATGSMAKVSFTADLTEETPGQTTVTAVADVTLRGRMAQFGTGVMRAAAGELVQEFARCANAALAQGPPAEGGFDGTSATASAAPAQAAPSTRGLVSILLRSLARTVVDRLRAAIRGRAARADKGVTS